MGSRLHILATLPPESLEPFSSYTVRNMAQTSPFTHLSKYSLYLAFHKKGRTSTIFQPESSEVRSTMHDKQIPTCWDLHQY